MKKFIKRITILFISIIIFILPYFVFALNPDVPPSTSSGQGSMKNYLENTGINGGFQTSNQNGTSLAEFAGMIIKAGLSLLGIVFIILIILAGYHWMTASGEQEKVNKAKDTILRAIIGLLLLVSAYAIWAFIFEKIMV